MIDVFFCTVEPFGSRTIRGQMRDLARSVWIRTSNARLRWLYGPDIPQFQRARRIDAEMSADGDIYVLTDDDMLPMGEHFISRGLEVMEKYPEFGILSAYPEGVFIQEWGEAKSYHKDVMEHVSVGGLRFIRRKAIRNWPPLNGKGYDREHCDSMRESGYSVGYMKDVKANHIGEGFSSVWV